MSQTPRINLKLTVEAIISSYEKDSCTRHVDDARLPNQAAVVELIHLLRDLLFPGFFGKQAISALMLPYHVGSLLDVIHDRLLRQVRHAVTHQQCRGDAEHGGTNETDPEQAVADFLGAIPHIRALLATDAQAAVDGDPAASGTDEVIIAYPGYFAITVHRIAHELHRRRVPLLPRIMSEHSHSLTGIDIHPGASIDESFFIDHGTGVVIGETTTIGKRVKIYQGVTLGALSTRGGQALRGTKRHPTLEDEVTVYSGASILGGDTVVGTGAVIGSNVFVTKSVPPHTRVMVKSPELQFRDRKPVEFKQELPAVQDWVI